MGVFAKLLGMDKADTIVAVGGDSLSFGVGTAGVPWKMPAYVAVEMESRRLVAVGDEAFKMRGREPSNIKVIRFTRHGGFGGDQDLGEAALRYVIKSRVQPKLIAPRVIAICPESQKLGLKNACVSAGAREVVTFRPVMAAAIGAGLKVEEPDLKAVFILERDWCAFGLISLSGFVVSLDLPLGTDALLEEVALHALATRNVALDLGALHDTFLASGFSGGELLGWETWLDELENGRVTSSTYNERDFSRAALPFGHRLRWHYRRAMEAADKAKVRDGGTARLHFFSPYAKLPGIIQLVSRVFMREVAVPDQSDMAMVRGGQELLRNLDDLYRIAVKK